MSVVAYPVADIRTSSQPVTVDQCQDLASKLPVCEVPPVWLDAGGCLVDGNHRLRAHELAGLTTIRALVLTEEQDDEYEELIGAGHHPMTAYAATTGAHSPPVYWSR